MAYGLKIRNTDSELQIDGSNVNYVWNGQSGSLDVYGLIGSSVELTTPSKYPPIALLRPTGGATDLCGVFDYTYSAPYYTHVRFFGGEEGFGAGTGAFDYRIYTVTEAIGSETHGMRIRSEESEIIYDTAKLPFKILEVGTATVESTYTHSAHSNPYYIFSPWLSGIVIVPIPPQGKVYRMMMGLAKQSSTSVQGKWVGYQTGIGMDSVDVKQGTTFTLILCDPN